MTEGKMTHKKVTRNEYNNELGQVFVHKSFRGLSTGWQGNTNAELKQKLRTLSR
jgi:hypothetical protein